VYLNAPMYAMICDEKLVVSGADMLFHAMPAGVVRDDDGWHLTLCLKEGLCEKRARVLVDCTADANVVSLAGFEVVQSSVLQPGTLIVRLGGYDPGALSDHMLRAAYRRVIEAGEFRDGEFGWGGKELGDRLMKFLHRRGGNAMHVPDIDAATSVDKTDAELKARALMLKMVRWLRTLPGLENLHLERMCPECAIRETVVIKGKTTITETDYASGRLFPDAVCYCYYSFDIHTMEGHGIDGGPLADGVVPTIPRAAMLPAGSTFFIVAGRHVSGDRRANSGYRVEAPCMAMGQAAGAMAALSAQTNVDPEELSLADIRELLRTHGAIVPGDVLV